MKVLFAGTPLFALPSLDAIARSDRHRLVGVLTQPDRPRARGRKVRPSPVKERAIELGLPVFQREKPSSAESVEELRPLAPDVAAVVAFGRILKKRFLDLPPAGCVNVHASLLPAYRGASPIERVVLSGEDETGVTTMMIDEGLDTGDILLQERTRVAEEETAGELAERLAAMGAALLVRTLDRIEQGDCPRTPQDDSRATYAPPVEKEEARIDWKAGRDAIVRLVRAMNPKPVAFTETSHGRMRVYRAVQWTGTGDPGTVLAADPKEGLVVAAGDGALRLEWVQLPGRSPMEDKALVSGTTFLPGDPLAEGR